MSFERSVALAVAALLSASPVLASEEPAAAAAPATVDVAGSRDLAGHTFQPTMGITSAFATTSFGTYLTAGYGTTTGRFTVQRPGDPAPPPQTFEGSVDYGAIGGAMAFEVAFLERFSARVAITESLYTGTTAAGAAVVGTNARLGAGLGLTASFAVAESLQLAAVVDASYAPRIGLLLGPALEDAYQSCSSGLTDCTFDFDKLFQQKNVFTVQPGVAASWVPWRPLGVSGNLSWTQSSLDQTGAGTTSAGAIGGGLAFDFDLLDVSPVPIGLQATVATQVPVSGDSGSRFTDVGGGVLYTGRPNLSAGVQFLVRRFAVAPTVDVSWSTVVVVTGLRYYW